MQDPPAHPVSPLRVRWLGTVPYRQAHALQQGLFRHGRGDWLLLLEHPHVFTLGTRGDPDHILVTPADVGAEVTRADRGGDVTYHGPGQLVGYPILDVPTKREGGMVDAVAYVRSIEQLVIDTLADLGLAGAGRLDGYPGVWVDPGGSSPRKIAAIGVRMARGRSMHGFALNVAPDMDYFGYIVPCGIPDKAVTSLRDEGIDASMREVVEAVVARATTMWAPAGSGRRVERADVAWRQRSRPKLEVEPLAGAARPEHLRAGRTERAGGLATIQRKPAWLRAKISLGERYRGVERVIRDLDLVTVCEAAGCPNASECWSEGTATFMINGDRCTRSCGFCLVDSRRPLGLDADEPERVARAVQRLGIQLAVVTAVARDDLADGGAGGFASTVQAIRQRNPGVGVEVLIPDCKGSPEALEAIFDARPDVLNHNIETVARLQSVVRPSGGYARSLSVLARSHASGLVTKSGLIVGLGETFDEVVEALADLAGVGCDIVTIGQYLRPTAKHLPVARWVPPGELDQLVEIGERQLGIGHVQASPLTRSSYHAQGAVAALAGTPSEQR